MTDVVQDTKKFTEEKKVVSWIKIVCGVASTVCFGFGVKSAYKQARPYKGKEFSKNQVFSGMGFATRALVVATILTCSGYALIIVAVTSVLNVNSPKDFGTKVKQLCGNRLRLSGSEKTESFESIFKK